VRAFHRVPRGDGSREQVTSNRQRGGCIRAHVLVGLASAVANYRTRKNDQGDDSRSAPGTQPPPSSRLVDGARLAGGPDKGHGADFQSLAPRGCTCVRPVRITSSRNRIFVESSHQGPSGSIGTKAGGPAVECKRPGYWARRKERRFFWQRVVLSIEAVLSTTSGRAIFFSPQFDDTAISLWRFAGLRAQIRRSIRASFREPMGVGDLLHPFAGPWLHPD